jgi:hypothetical protein
MRKLLVPFVVMFLGLSALASDYDRLAAMQTVIRAEVDGTKICKETLKNLSSITLAALPMLMEARVKESIGASSPESLKAFFSDLRIKACADKCRCGIYADWAGSVPALSSVRDRLLAQEKATPMTEKTIAACARLTAGWVCHDRTFLSVIARARKETKGAEK